MVTFKLNKKDLDNEDLLSILMQTNTTKKNILYINLSNTNTDLIRHIVKTSFSSDLYVTNTYADATTIVRNFIFDMIIIDINDINDSTNIFLQKVVGLSDKKIPVMLINNQELGNKNHTDESLPFDDLLMKPVDIDRFLYKVSSLIN